MRVAWLRPHGGDAAPDRLDATAQLIAELRSTHDIEAIDARAAHDVVWRQARHPFDLFVHELDDAAAHAFVPAYAVHFPGILMLRGFGAHHPRAIAASRLVVVGDEAVAASLQEKYVGTPIVAAPIGLEPGPADGMTQALARSTVTRFGVLDDRRRDVVERAATRAQQGGAPVEVLAGLAESVLRDAEVIVALDWPPPSGPPVTALAGLAAGKPVIVLETLVSAAWPALDPQTWQPRGYAPARARAAFAPVPSALTPSPPSTSPPIAVSLDPRDEEHSLMLAMKRLSTDAPLRERLGRAGHDWWSGHATIAHAAAAWRRILNDPGPPPRPFAGADGSDHAREVLAAFGVQVDFL